MDKRDTYHVEIAHRPWYEWLAWAIWLMVTIFTVQNAVASSREFESAAATIFWAATVVLLVGGGIVWYLRRQRLPG